MRKPTVKNKYKLKISDIKKLKVNDWSKVCEPLFWKNTVVNAWCWSHVIEHGQYPLSDIPEGDENKGEELNDFQEWLAGELFIHVNGMGNYFYNHGILIINEK